MEDPRKEIATVVLQLTATDSPDVQKATVERYMTSDVSFRHPVCSVASGPNSRHGVLGIYQWYRVLSPNVDLNVESIGKPLFDESKNVLYLEAVQRFRLFFLPIKPAPARLITRITLRKKNGLYYIAEQEDFYHPEDFAALLFPHVAPFVRYGLAAGGMVSNIMYQAASLLGFWSPQFPAVDADSEPTPSEAGLYDKDN
ncbi:hypothetical protein B0H34DRAFT_823324 [Crassisporium funariophilum]|nr:hypothetical protein B0H34DRAFT_823324 [Crassisporium funariophilum]